MLAAASAMLVLLWAANVPFYSVSTIGDHNGWRIEHGRLGMRLVPFVHHEGFYIAGNTEGLKFAPDWHVWAWNDWNVVLPLWMPLLLCAAGSFWMFRTSHRPKGGCVQCGYDLLGLSTDARGVKSPECGGKGDRHRAPGIRHLEEY